MNKTYPIITLNIESMKHCISTAMSEHILEMDKMVQDAINDFCTEDNLKRIINEQVQLCIKQAVKEGIMFWFTTTGEGRKVCMDAAHDYLNRVYGETKK